MNSIIESDLEKWIRKKHMTTVKFAELVGCTRPVIYKVKNNQPISPKFANKIVKITDGEVVPKVMPKGRKKKEVVRVKTLRRILNDKP